MRTSKPERAPAHGELDAAGAQERRSILVRGTVQGVGFRPFVHRLASQLGLRGFVQSRVDGVRIDVEGPRPALDRFLKALATTAPPLARVEAVHSASVPLSSGCAESGFRIARSDDTPFAGSLLVCPDVATCAECLVELFSPGDRRYGYPFICCASCGPRLTIVERAPYDRDRTTMAAFSMCERCRTEYDDPHSRRFHAQPNGCPECGPRLSALDAKGQPVPGDALRAAVQALRDGKIVALKGLGGYQLACDATRQHALTALRRRTRRHEKPLAVMVGDLVAAEAIAVLSAAEKALLESAARPIVLVQRRHSARLARAVAPDLPSLGILLPSTPLHHLLLHAMAGTPLVMTGASPRDEPILDDDEEALATLRGVADLFLVHDRRIALQCDDSIARVFGSEPVLLRRSRGYAPTPLPLFAHPCFRPILALGGQRNATFALGQGASAFVSHHLGDLGKQRTYRAYEAAIAHYEALLRWSPTLLVHDLHPDYASTLYARERGARDGIPLLAVQHLHAHMASCMAEHGVQDPVIGVTFDGASHGTDGALWGGEFLLGDCSSFERAAQLRYVPMLGGEAAAREPWRAALSHLADAGASDAADHLLSTHLPAAELRALGRRARHAPLCSSMGCLFDAVAALLGLRMRTSFGGQAALDLEWLAALRLQGQSRAYPFDVDVEEDRLVVDTRPLVCEIASDRIDGMPPGVVARNFHETVAQIVEVVCLRLRDRSGLNAVVLSGGVFQNALIRERVGQKLRGAGFRVHEHGRVPPNDAGLAFGQLAVALAAGGTRARIV